MSRRWLPRRIGDILYARQDRIDQSALVGPRGGPLGRQVRSGTRARRGRGKDATGAAGRMRRRRHHERHGHDDVHVRWHEYRGTAGDVKTSVVRRGVDIDRRGCVMPHRQTRDHWVTEEAYAIQPASFPTGYRKCWRERHTATR
jgi:hypothetical protein